MKNKTIYILVLLLSISLVSALPPFQQSNSVIGVEIESPIISTHIYNQDFKFHIHTYNATDGTRFTNDTISCFIHLYSPIDGAHLIEDNMSFDSNGIDFEYNVGGGNFTEIGQYAVLFDCEDTTVGGFLEYGFDVTPNGESLSTGGGILYSLFSLILFGIICIVSFFLIAIPSENEKDDQGFATKVIRLKYLRPLLIVVLYILSVLLLNFLTGISINFATLSMFSGILGFLFEMMMRLTWPFTILIIVWIIYMLVKDTNINRQFDKFDKFDPIK